MIRCYQCKFFKPLGRSGINGWCKDNRDGKPSIRVQAIDYCDDAVLKEEESKE